MRQGERRQLWRDIKVGIKTVWHNPYLRAIMVMSGLWNLLNNIAETVFLLYAVIELHIKPDALGLIVGGGAVGGLIGSAISTQLSQRGTFGPVLGIAFTFGCVPWLLLPAVTGSLPLEIAVCTLAFFLVRVGLGLWGVLTVSFRQTITPHHLLGRVTASLRFVSFGLGSLGFLLSGVLGSLLGLRPALWLAALGFVAILLVTLLATPLPRLRAIPTGPAEPETAGPMEERRGQDESTAPRREPVAR